MCYWCAPEGTEFEDPGEAFGNLIDCPCCGKYRMTHKALYFFFSRPGEPAPVKFTEEQRIKMRVFILNENIAERIPNITAKIITLITGAKSEGFRFSG